MTAPIEAVGVTKQWADGSGLRPITFTVSAGQLVVVRGRSGSGKSTLLGIVGALCQPDAGSILVNGRALDTTVPPTWHEVTLVPQTLALAVELTVRENVGDACSGGGDELDRLLAALDLDTLADSTPDALSMGEQQRCAVARAVAAKPLVLLADEPTSHQDADRAEAVLRCLHDAAQQGTAVLVATHDPVFAQVADLVIELEVH